MIASQPRLSVPPIRSSRLSWWRVGLFVLVVLLIAGAANAASLRICFDDVDVNTAKVRVEADGSPLYDDVLADSTLSGGTRRCNVRPIPATMVRGRDFAITLRGVNAFEEVGPASNVVTFRPPALPGQIKNPAIQVVVP